MMKKFTLRTLLIVALVGLLSDMYSVSGQPTSPPPPPSVGGQGGNQPANSGSGGGAPIDGGIAILLTLGAAYGAGKIWNTRKKIAE